MGLFTKKRPAGDDRAAAQAEAEAELRRAAEAYGAAPPAAPAEHQPPPPPEPVAAGDEGLGDERQPATVGAPAGAPVRRRVRKAPPAGGPRRPAG